MHSNFYLRTSKSLKRLGKYYPCFTGGRTEVKAQNLAPARTLHPCEEGQQEGYAPDDSQLSPILMQ